MKFIRKYELFFGLGFILAFFVPFILQYFGIISFLNIEIKLYPLLLIASMAAVPVYVWTKMFNKENPEDKSTILFAFLAGCTSTIPVFFYRGLFTSETVANLIFFKAQAVSFHQNISEIFGYQSLSHLYQAGDKGSLLAILGIMFVAITVGVMEEISKHVVVNTNAIKYLGVLVAIIGMISIFGGFTPEKFLMIAALLTSYFFFLRILVSIIKFKSIDDFIEVCIVAALGFTFIENIHYLLVKFDAIPANSFALLLIFRATVVTIVHILCSGVLGYHIGLAHFAHPLLKEKIREKRNNVFIKVLGKLFDMNKESAFRLEQIIIGILWAVGLHAGYDFFMQVQFKIFGIPAFAIIMPLYFFGGIWYLRKLLRDKESHKKFGLVVIKEVCKKE